MGAVKNAFFDEINARYEPVFIDPPQAFDADPLIRAEHALVAIEHEADALMADPETASRFKDVIADLANQLLAYADRLPRHQLA